MYKLPRAIFTAKQTCHSHRNRQNFVTTADFGLSALYFNDTR